MEFWIFIGFVILVFTLDDAWKRHNESKIQLEVEKRRTIEAETKLVQARAAETQAIASADTSTTQLH